MSGTQVQLRRNTAAIVAANAGAPGEITPDMTNMRLTVHDGTTLGGFPQARYADTIGRNKLINPTGGVNQRGVSGTVTLAAGAYGQDRFKAGASGCTYAFGLTATGDTLFNISAGSLVQLIDAPNINYASNVVSWLGTSPARAYQGTPASSTSPSYSGGVAYVDPFDGARNKLFVGGLTTNTITALEFGVGYFVAPQFEANPLYLGPTLFERRHLAQEIALCQRYYQQFGGNSTAEYFASGVCSGGFAAFNMPTRVRMRVSPTFTVVNIGNFAIYDGTVNTVPSALTFSNTSPDNIGFGLTASGLTTGRGAMLQANANSSGLIQASAEL